MTLFLDRMASLVLKYDKMNRLSRKCSGFPIFSGFYRIFLKFSYFNTFYHSLRELMRYILNMIWLFSLNHPYFPGFFPDLHVPAILTMFLYRIYGLLLKNYMKIFRFLEIFRNFFKASDLGFSTYCSDSLWCKSFTGL